MQLNQYARASSSALRFNVSGVYVPGSNNNEQTYPSALIVYLYQMCSYKQAKNRLPLVKITFILFIYSASSSIVSDKSARQIQRRSSVPKQTKHENKIKRNSCEQQHCLAQNN